MALEKSILKATKKTLSLNDAFDEFDQDVLMHINTCFFILNQLGVGPPSTFMIEDDETEWDEFTDSNVSLNAVKSFIYLKVRLLFDPPGTPHHIVALEDQLKELTYRLLMERDSRTWGVPVDVENFYDIVLDGGDSSSGG